MTFLCSCFFFLCAAAAAAFCCIVKCRLKCEWYMQPFKRFEILRNYIPDEMIVKYHGFSSLEEFICIRSGRFGRKLWTDCGTSRYYFKFNFCCGKNPKNNEDGDLLLWSGVVWNMLEYTHHPYSYCVFSDNALKSRDLMVYIGLLGY